MCDCGDGDDGEHWIPAFAGMTEMVENAEGGVSETVICVIVVMGMMGSTGYRPSPV